MKTIIFTSLLLAISMTASAKTTKHIDIDHTPRIADVSRDTRKACKGARPKIKKLTDKKYLSKFICRNELRRILFIYKVVK